MIDNINIRPLITPLIALLKSRKVIVSLSALLMNFVVAALPDLQPFRGELMTVITGLALGLIGGIAYEDAARAGRDAGSLPPMSNADLIKLLLSDLIDSISTNLNGQTVITLKK
ncbi:MAG: hypothetical protein GC204_20740 [Chloroflexi bacterium]|nr:hypothetical protein [Chloroflexota bacterium]